MGEARVQWREWGEEAFREAREQDKPILLSISATWCHWCHVMDRGIPGDPIHTGTYSDPQIAEIINTYFVPIRVDTDRRPDINARYNMGGWPTTVFLTPDGEILTGATYIPPMQMRQVLLQVLQYYRSNRSEIQRRAQEIARRRQEASRPVARPGAQLSWTIPMHLIGLIARAYDPVYGGFGEAPKFPHPEACLLLLVEYTRGGRRDERLAEMVHRTLHGMADGGMYDHVEGGWFRYSTTRDWSLPHFEKMLEDHARLIPLYLYAAEVLEDDGLRQAALKALEYVQRTLYDPERSVFWGSQDADEEYYALSRRERAMRPPPAVDRTVYVNWNAQMALAWMIAGDLLQDPAWTERALQVLDTVWTLAFDEGAGALYHYVDEKGERADRKGVPPLLGDQVQFGRAALAAFQRTGERRFLERALRLRTYLESALADSEGGGFFDRPEDPRAIGALRIRQKPLEENAAAAEFYLTLYDLTGDHQAREIAERTLLAFEQEYVKYDFTAAPYGLAVYRAITEPVRIHVIGPKEAPETRRLLQAAWRGDPFHRVVVPMDPRQDAPAIQAQGFPLDEWPAAYVCVGTRCLPPARTPEELAERLRTSGP
ncbi:Cellobiose 2-epimerase [Candidatus Thermoflexus japonica]|uniref:Cellobiose 2-epimerase n=1 Tax=Candidatus Thermoflexus japonica TaxID=2035417 RepID=A0A2H5YA47_9CHLR|nr:Cellobiose 2-epimerase [Candidatus Thermoflexus japonica]